MQDKKRRSLIRIKQIVDCYKKGNYTITVGHDDFDTDNHIYDINVIMGMIQNHVFEGLG